MDSDFKIFFTTSGNQFDFFLADGNIVIYLVFFCGRRKVVLTGPRLSNPLRAATSWAKSLFTLRRKRTRKELVKMSLREDENTTSVPQIRPKRQNHVNCIAQTDKTAPASPLVVKRCEAFYWYGQQTILFFLR